MDFDLSDDQRLLKDSVERLVADRYDFESRKRAMALPDGWSREMWAQFAELGLLGLPFDEAVGGFGGGPAELMIVMEAFGRGLVLEPYLASVVLGGGLVQRAGNAAQQAELLGGVASGALLLAFAQQERFSRWNLADVQTRAVADGAVWRISGEKGVVLHGDVAGKLLVTARSGGARTDPHGVGLFVVDAAQPGVTRRGYPTQDGLRAAEIVFDNAVGEALGDPGGALPAVQATVDAALAALCAEAVGAMACMHEATVDYLKTRKQFGRAIGEFQVLQHRSVDMLVALEQARSMTMFATLMAAEADAAARGRAISAAKVQVGQAARHIGQEAVQLHGGIAMTMEYKVGHYFKRTAMIEKMFGDTDHHLRAVADAGSLF